MDDVERGRHGRGRRPWRGRGGRTLKGAAGAAYRPEWGKYEDPESKKPGTWIVTDTFKPVEPIAPLLRTLSRNNEQPVGNYT